MIVLPNSHREPPAYVPRSHEFAQPKLFTARDAVELNQSFASAKIPAAVAPSDIWILNRLVSSKSSIGVQFIHFTAHDIEGANSSFLSVGSRSYLTEPAASILDTYYSQRVSRTNATLTGPDTKLDERNLLLERLLAPFIRLGNAIADLLAGYCEQLGRNPRATILPALAAVLYYLLTVSGIFASSAYDELGSTSSLEPVGFGDVVRRGFTSAGWQGVLASPLIFSVVWASVETPHISMSMSLLAFQNGCFWRGTLRKIGRQLRPTQRPAHAVSSSQKPKQRRKK
jgi:hypothetical protein